MPARQSLGDTRTKKLSCSPLVLAGENGAMPIIRALAMAGISSAVASTNPRDITFKSRYCLKPIHLHAFGLSTDSQNVQTLVEHTQHLGCKPVLLWGSDPETLFISRNRKILCEHFRYVLPSQKLTNSLVNKRDFARLAEHHCLPVPRTYFMESMEEVRNAMKTLPFPCTVKPLLQEAWHDRAIEIQYGSYKHALRRLETAEELIAYLKTLPNIGMGLVLQEYIEGRDEKIVSFHGYFDSSGQFVAGFAGRKIRTNPIHFGGSSYVETVHMPELLQLAKDICMRLGFKGIVKIDFKQKPCTGQFYILEFNVRFTLWCYLGAVAGLNLPTIWYEDLMNGNPRVATKYESGVKWLAVAQDLRSLPAYLRAGEWTALGILRSYSGAKVFHTFAWNDPIPFAFAFPRFVKRKVKRWSLRLRSKQEFGRAYISHI